MLAQIIGVAKMAIIISVIAGFNFFQENNSNIKKNNNLITTNYIPI